MRGWDTENHPGTRGKQRAAPTAHEKYTDGRRKKLKNHPGHRRNADNRIWNFDGDDFNKEEVSSVYNLHKVVGLGGYAGIDSATTVTAWETFTIKEG